MHRDIKPANIMLRAGTDIKIADFGAALADARARWCRPRRSARRITCRPSRCRAEPLDFHSDMYLAGRVLYELLTGQRPFIAENLDALIGKILKRTPCRRASCARDCRRRSIWWCCARSRRTRCSATQTWPEFGVELSKVGELVLPAGAIPDSEKYVTLKSVAMLAPLADSELWELARAGKWSRVPKGKPVVQEEQRGRSFFFLAKGEAKVIKNKKLLNMVNGGECFGEMAYIGGGEQPRHATVEAMSELLLAEFEPARAREDEPRRAASPHARAGAQRHRPPCPRQRPARQVRSFRRRPGWRGC